MEKSNHYIVFMLEDLRCAVALESVERVVRAVEVVRLPDAPEAVLGIINVMGKIVPVMNLRKRFRLPEKEIEPSDCFIIALCGKHTVALAANEAAAAIEISETDVIASDEVLPGLEHVKGIVKLQNDLVIIQNLNRFLSIEEENFLSEGLTNSYGGVGSASQPAE